MQSQIMCNGCRTILLYPRGASNVRCAVCHTVTPVQSTPLPSTNVQYNGMEMDQIICGCCHTLLMYTRGAPSVRCLCCQTVNLTNANPPPVSNQVATVRCGSCQMTLMYPYGAPSVKCAVCQYITNVGTANGSIPSSNHRQNGVATSSSPTAVSDSNPSTQSIPQSQTQTVVVENPMSFDGSGKLVSNVVVGVTTEKK